MSRRIASGRRARSDEPLRSAAAVAQEALQRARSFEPNANDTIVLMEFVGRGIPFDEIRPRENVFTFHAWKALGRSVKKGEHGVHLTTWIPVASQDRDGEEQPRVFTRPKTAVVFHISQTEPIENRK
jgi:hypothetical protein